MIIHVDMSQKFSNMKNIGVAWISTDRQHHKGLALSGKLIKKLVNEVGANHDFARLYAICIFLILRDDISKVSEIIICNDEDFTTVKKHLERLFISFPDFSQVRIDSIFDFRKRIGRDIKSLADGIAASYRKRGLKENRWNKGYKLNVIRTRYKEIFYWWYFLEGKGRE